MKISESKIKIIIRQILLESRDDSPQTYHLGNESNVLYLKKLLKDEAKNIVEGQIRRLFSNTFAKKVLKNIKKEVKNKPEINDLSKYLIPSTVEERSPFSDKTGNYKSDMSEYAKIVKEVNDKLLKVLDNLFFLSDKYSSKNDFKDEETFKRMKSMVTDPRMYKGWNVGGNYGPAPVPYGHPDEDIPHEQRQAGIVINDAVFWKMFEEKEAGFFMGCKNAKDETKIRIYALFGMARYAELSKAMIHKQVLPRIQNTLVHELGHALDMQTEGNAVIYFAKKLLANIKEDHKTPEEALMKKYAKGVVKPRYFKSIYQTPFGSSNYLNLETVEGRTEITVRIDSLKRYISKKRGAPKTNVYDFTLTAADIKEAREDFVSKLFRPVGKLAQIHQDVNWFFNPEFGIIDPNASDQKVADFFNAIR